MNHHALALVAATLFLASPKALEAQGTNPNGQSLVSIDATLAVDRETIWGVAEFRISNPLGSPLEQIPIHLYPNRFRTINPNLDDRMVRWIYPVGESYGGMDLTGGKWNGKDLDAALDAAFKSKGENQTLVRMQLPTPLGPGETGILKLHFKTKIPERRGRFGRWRGFVSLGGGWFPRPAADLKGADLSLPPEPLLADVKITLPPSLGAVLNDRVYRRVQEAQTIEARNLRCEVMVLVIMDLMEVDEKEFSWGKVTHVHRELRNKKPTWGDTRDDPRRGGLPSGLTDHGDVDISGRIFEVADSTAGLIRQIDEDVPLLNHLVLVDVPAWDRMVQPGPGPVLVSDRLWRVFPIEVGLWFHDLSLSRQVAAALLRPFVSGKEPLAYRYVTTDTVGAYFADRYLDLVITGGKSVEEMLGFASFLPTVDNILYAPQLPFREVYARSVEETDPLRDEPWRSTNDLPRGKRILGKITDLLGKDGTGDFMAKYLKSRDSFSTSLDHSLGERAIPFKKQWYGKYPRVNYRVGEVRDEKTQGGEFLHRIELIREGDSIEEPVTVHLTDEDDQSVDLVWDGKGESRVVEWKSRAPIESVQIDPARRLVETNDVRDGHPLGDNFDRLEWRVPMLSRFQVSGDVISGDPLVEVGLILRRRYDISNAIAISGLYAPRSFGGSLGYLRYFGKKRTLNARTWYFGPFLSATRYREVVDGGQYLPESTLFGATAGSLRLVLGRDDRTYFYDPQAGSGFSLRLGYSLGRDDSGETVQVGQVDTRFVGLLSPAIRHTFAFQIGGIMVAGSPAAAQLASLSVREILKGFDIDETYGLLGLFSVLEYRFTFLEASHIRAPLFWWFDRFQGVLFAGGGTISDPTGYEGLFQKRRLYTEAGCGLRIHLLAAGVQQYIIALDLAFPITPTNRNYEIEQADGSYALTNRDGFKIKFGISQTF